MDQIKEKEVDIKKLKGRLNDVALSKDVHAIEFFTSVGEKYPIVSDYEIPKSYHIDSIVIMPVDPKKVYVYWEITDELLESKLKESSITGFTIKVFEVNLGAPRKKQEKEVYSFHDKREFGSRYIDYPASLKPLVAKIGVAKDGKFIELLKAKPVSIPSFEVLGPDENLWTSRFKELPEEERILIKKTAKKEDTADKEMEILKNILQGRLKETDILNVFMGIMEERKGVSGNETKVMELLKGFLEVRVKDIELLRLFLELIEQLKLAEGSKGTISQYYDEIKRKLGEVSSSEFFQKK